MSVMIKYLILRLRIAFKDYLDKRRTKKLISKLVLDDRVPSSEYLDIKRFK